MSYYTVSLIHVYIVDGSDRIETVINVLVCNHPPSIYIYIYRYIYLYVGCSSQRTTVRLTLNTLAYLPTCIICIYIHVHI